MGNDVNDFFQAELLAESIRRGIPGVNALYGTSAVTIKGGMPMGRVGTSAQFPYMSALGDAEVITSSDDDTEATVDLIFSDSEQATIKQCRKLVEVTNWASMAALSGDDPYEVMKGQFLPVLGRAFDGELLDEAFDENISLVHDIGTDPLDMDAIIDAQALSSDEGQNDQSTALMVVHPKVLAGLKKLKDDNGQYLMKTVMVNGKSVPIFDGAPVAQSRRLGVDTASWGAVTEAGTSPPDLTLSGSPLNNYSLKVKITTGGTLTNAKFKYSLNGGKTYSKAITTAATYVMPGTGTTLNFASGTYSTDNVYTADVSVSVYRSLIARPGSMGIWFNSAPLVLEDVNIAKPSRRAAIHVWFMTHVYHSMPGEELPGTTIIKHGLPSAV